MSGMVTVHKGQSVGMTTSILESALSWTRASRDDIIADLQHVVDLARERTGDVYEPAPRSPLLEAMERRYRDFVAARDRRREQRGQRRASARSLRSNQLAGMEVMVSPDAFVPYADRTRAWMR